MHFTGWNKRNVKKDGGLGLRHLEDVNKAQTAKLVGRFLSNGDGKYLQTKSFWECKQVSNCTSYSGGRGIVIANKSHGSRTLLESRQ